MDGFDHEYDVIVVGSGAAGLTAAWTAKRAGLSVVVIEKAAVFGGNSVLSGGGAWMPNCPELLRHGQKDDPDRLLDYLRAIAPEVDSQRQRRFLEECPRLHRTLETELPIFRNAFTWISGYSDYHVKEGGNPLGRGVWPTPIKYSVIGDDARRLRPGRIRMDMPKGTQRLWITSRDLKDLIKLEWDGWRLLRIKTVLRFAWRIVMGTLTREYIATSGRALIIRLRHSINGAGVPLWLEVPLKSLITRDGAVIGINAEREGKPIRIAAKKGVIIAAGGFEFSDEMRRKYQPELPHAGGFSCGAESNTGDGIRAAEQVGAATGLMDGAWWMPALMLPHGPAPTVYERQAPNQFIVNSAGLRFVNESGPYTEFGTAQIAGQKTGIDHIPAYMITDHYGWTHNLIASHRPGTPLPQDWIDHGSLVIADSMDQLAQRIGVPPAALVATAARFNEFARAGRDLDFDRGASAYDNLYGNSKLQNPNLAEVSKRPFYALKMGLSDLGTRGGLLTNPNAQVLKASGEVIPGLYAAGNSSATIMGYRYAGPGATIGPAMTFGWIAANHIASQR